jgi:energy-coupling factor transport system ATP-binding protein
MSLEVKDVSHIFQNGTPFAQEALKGVSFSVKKGEIVGIMGKTGSGKSTLLQAMGGLLRPSSGTVLVDGEDIYKLKKKEISRIRQKVGIVFQYPEHQIFELTVYDEIAFGPRNMDMGPETVRILVEKALADVGLSFEAFKGRKTYTLSSGEKRKVAIASILALDTPYLLLDEPTAGLDYEASTQLMGYLVKLKQTKNTTIIIVSHNSAHIFPIADRLMLLDQGRIVTANDPVHWQEAFRERQSYLPQP